MVIGLFLVLIGDGFGILKESCFYEFLFMLKLKVVFEFFVYLKEGIKFF